MTLNIGDQLIKLSHQQCQDKSALGDFPDGRGNEPKGETAIVIPTQTSEELTAERECTCMVR